MLYEVITLDPRDGRTVWRKEGLGPVYATPLLDNALLVVGDNLGQLSA